jgi:hypothetical protein
VNVVDGIEFIELIFSIKDKKLEHQLNILSTAPALCGSRDRFRRSFPVGGSAQSVEVPDSEMQRVGIFFVYYGSHCLSLIAGECRAHIHPRQIQVVLKSNSSFLCDW